VYGRAVDAEMGFSGLLFPGVILDDSVSLPPASAQKRNTLNWRLGKIDTVGEVAWCKKRANYFYLQAQCLVDFGWPVAQAETAAVLSRDSLAFQKDSEVNRE
jgi:hypothetical protein